MMHSVTMIVLHAFIAHAAANQLSNTEDSMDRLADNLVDKLAGRILGTTAAKPMIPRVPFLSSQSSSMGIQNNLNMYGIGSNPMEKLAITAIEANNRAGGRDISAKAKSQIVSGWTLEDEKTKDRLRNMLSQVKHKESLLAGITAPLGYFDPLGFTTYHSGGKMLFYREVELKHGRVAMLASLGLLVGEQYHPLFGGDVDVPSYIAFQQTPLENFWPAVVAAIAIPEIFSVLQFQDPSKGETWAMKEDHMPGDLGFDPLGLKPTDPKEFKTMQTKELNNGRLAMIAAAGMIAQEIATGQKLF